MINPLSPPKPREPGRLELLLRYFPIVGWLIAAQLQIFRFGEAFDVIDGEMKARSREEVEAEWARFGYSMAEVQPILGAMVQGASFSSGLLCPGDSMEALTFDDEGEWQVVAFELTEIYGKSAEQFAWAEGPPAGMRLIDLVTDLIGVRTDLNTGARK